MGPIPGIIASVFRSDDPPAGPPADPSKEEIRWIGPDGKERVQPLHPQTPKDEEGK